jgi:hypothetical protein
MGQELDALMEEPGSLKLQRAVADLATASPADMLALQRRYGNKAVSGLIQTKLTVGAVGDSYEQEADRVADQVMSMPEGTGGQWSVGTDQPVAQRQEEEEELQMKAAGPQPKPLVESITPLVQRQEEEEELMTKPDLQRQEEEEELMTKPDLQRQEEEEELMTKPDLQRQEEEEELMTKPDLQRQEEEEELQMKPVAVQQDGSFEASSGVENRLAAEKGGGSPLAEEVRAHLEPRFGADFSAVRVHTGDTATQLNRDLGSRAFTHGQDVYFKGGAYDPGTSSGQKLLAHELTHTVQQGAAKRIQTWAPTGHRLVSEAAFERDDELKGRYTDDAKKLLIDRAPDMDGIQDQFTSMMQGMAEGKERIKQYEAYIAGGDDESARRMWEQNQIHFRPPTYMLSHGEGGLYKQDQSAASAINEAMTKKLLDKAVDLWNWEDEKSWATSLAMLSDTLHQAEDRGSHQEGEGFRGHDARLGVFQWKKKYDDRPLKDWEKLPGAPTMALEGKWDPDNASKNPKGAILGVAFAQGALRSFANRIKAKESESYRGADRVVKDTVWGPEGMVPGIRHVRFHPKLWFALRPSTWIGKGKMKSVKGKRTSSKRKELQKILESGKEQLKAIGQLTDEELEQAGRAPQIGELGEGEPERLEEGFKYYERGAGFNKVYKEAEEKFREWRKPRIRGGYKKSKRIREAKAYYVNKVKDLKNEPEQLKQVANSILMAYTQVFKVRLYPAGQEPYLSER